MLCHVLDFSGDIFVLHIAIVVIMHLRWISYLAASLLKEALGSFAVHELQCAQ